MTIYTDNSLQRGIYAIITNAVRPAYSGQLRQPPLYYGNYSLSQLY